jgi:hypothetical protein
MYIAVAEHKINFCNSIQINISCFHFIIVTLKTFLLETIAKTRPLSIYDLVMYISCVHLTFATNVFITFSFQTKHKDDIIYMVLILYIICIASTYVF